MRRDAIQVFLIGVSVLVLVGGWYLNELGASEPVSYRCQRFEVARQAQGLARGGELDAARELLTTDAKKVNGSDDPPQLPAFCTRALLQSFRSESFSGRIVAGSGLVVRSLAEGQLPDQGDSAKLGIELSSGSATTVRTATWLLPLVLGLLLFREFTIVRIDRRPGPVDVLPVLVRSAGAEPGTEQKDPVFRARLARYLSELEIAPKGETHGGIGDIVVPVVESAQDAGNNVAAIGNLIRRLILPESGFEVASVVYREDDVRWLMTLEIRTRRSGVLIESRRVVAGTERRLASQAAAVIYQEVVRLDSIKRGIPMWARWDSVENLATFIELNRHPAGTSLVELEKLVNSEPANLSLRHRLARAHHQAGLSHFEAGHKELAADHLRSMTEHLLSATQLAPDLVEPRAQLTGAFTMASKWIGVAPAKPAKDAQTISMLLSYLEGRQGILESLDTWSIRRGLQQGTMATVDDLSTLALDEARGAMWRSTLPFVMARWLRRHTRSSVPGRLLVPFSPQRRKTILNLRSIQRYVDIRRFGAGTLEATKFARALQLLWLSLLCRLLPRTNLSFTHYNLALCYAQLGHKCRRYRMKARAERGMKYQLHLAHLAPRGDFTLAEIRYVLTDDDMQLIPDLAESWLKGLGMPVDTDVGQSRKDAWQLLLDVAEQWSEQWENCWVEATGHNTVDQKLQWQLTQRMDDLISRDRKAVKQLSAWCSEGADAHRIPSTCFPTSAAIRTAYTATDLPDGKSLIAVDSAAEAELAAAPLSSDLATLDAALAQMRPISWQQAQRIARLRRSAWVSSIQKIEKRLKLE